MIPKPFLPTPLTQYCLPSLAELAGASLSLARAEEPANLRERLDRLEQWMDRCCISTCKPGGRVKQSWKLQWDRRQNHGNCSFAGIDSTLGVEVEVPEGAYRGKVGK